MFDFAGSTCTHASWDEDGSLHLRFSDGHEIHAHSDERSTAWELYGKLHGYAACLRARRGRASSGTTCRRTNPPNASDSAHTDRRVFESAW